ncbi:MAG: HDIG domain-containing protein [candidate division Zixibacteria bacterium]|nr:HDIG domain-containing protein [candidate division Zixibacteria bacterium]
MCRLSEEVVQAIGRSGRVYEVGGVVRDRLMGMDVSSKDRDYLVTGISYDDLTSLLRPHGNVELVGRSFGVIKFTQFHHGQPHTFDIALPRKEHSTGVGHRDFAINFDPNLPVEDDLMRRDFTINAMALALDDQTLVDPLGGREDIARRQLRMTSERSFEEDPLRMLRAMQFAARLDFTIEERTLEAITRNAGLIQSVSPERIAEELNKMLTLAAKPSIGFRLMEQTGLLRAILPELSLCVGVDQPGPYHAHDVFEHTIRVVDATPPRLRVRLAALFHDIRKPQAKRPTDDGRATFYGHEATGARTVHDVLARLRYSREITNDVSTLVGRHMFTTDVTDKGLRRLVKKVGVDLIFDLLDLRRADVIGQGMGGRTDDVDQFEAAIRAELEKKPPFGYSDLAISGHDIMTLFGIEPGPMVGSILAHLLDKALDDPSINTPESLTALARQYFEEIKKRDMTYNRKGTD